MARGSAQRPAATQGRRQRQLAPDAALRPAAPATSSHHRNRSQRCLQRREGQAGSSEREGEQGYPAQPAEAPQCSSKLCRRSHHTSCRCSGGRGETRCQVQPPRGAGAGPVDAGSPTPGSREGRDLSWGGMGGRAAVEGEGAGSAAHGMPRTAASCPCTARPSWGTVHYRAFPHKPEQANLGRSWPPWPGVLDRTAPGRVGAGRRKARAVPAACRAVLCCCSEATCPPLHSTFRNPVSLEGLVSNLARASGAPQPAGWAPKLTSPRRDQRRQPVQGPAEPAGTGAPTHLSSQCGRRIAGNIAS